MYNRAASDPLPTRSTGPPTGPAWWRRAPAPICQPIKQFCVDPRRRIDVSASLSSRPGCQSNRRQTKDVPQLTHLPPSVSSHLAPMPRGTCRGLDVFRTPRRLPACFVATRPRCLVDSVCQRNDAVAQGSRTATCRYYIILTLAAAAAALGRDGPC